ncbi:hypothetical protein BC937DRAFT_90292 [Endogone sp. FLAS-F59071]|nr:hypothetical protein BC937DRAFT_90292 [Endogone sp. FLAS-F59071]|eukprot:RUS17188.1 hypothetical protein BC937DRAFT_90292 [Endogone sp. FLAS-F59071]
MTFLYSIQRALPFFRALPCRPAFQVATLISRKPTVPLRSRQWIVPSIGFRTFSSTTLHKEKPDSEFILQEYNLLVRDRRLSTFSPEDFVKVLVALRNSKSADAIENMTRVAQDFYQVHGASAVHGYSILIHAYLSRKNLKAAEALFLEMQSNKELFPTTITILTMIDGISKMYNTTELHNFCRQLEEVHIPFSLDVYKRLIVAFGQHGDPTSANVYFRQMISKGIQPDTAIYTSLIGVFVNHKDLIQARALFEEMEVMKIPPSVAIYHILIQAYRKTKRNSQAEELYQHLISSGIPPNSSIYVAMDMEPTKALEEMYMLGIVPSVRDFNTFMSIYIKQNDFLSAGRLFQRMQKDKVEPDVVSYSLVIDALIKNQQLERAFELYKAMKHAGLKPDVVLYTLLIQAFAQTSDLNGALNLLETMRDHQVLPNLYTFNTLLSVVSSRRILTDRDRDFAKAIFHKMKEMRTFPDARTYNLMLSVLSKHIISSTSPPLSPSTSTEFISQRPLHPNLTDMQSLYREMCSSPSSQPDFLTYSILINSFLESGNIRFGTIIYNEMRSRKITPTVQIFNSLMKAYKKQGPAAQVFSIWNDMRMARITPDNNSYIIVLEACQQYGHMDTLQVIQKQRYQDSGYQQLGGMKNATEDEKNIFRVIAKIVKYLVQMDRLNEQM